MALRIPATRSSAKSPAKSAPLQGEVLPPDRARGLHITDIGRELEAPSPPATTSPTDKIALARAKGMTAVGWANALEVANNADFKVAADYLSSVVKLGLSWWDQIRDPGIARAKKLWDDAKAEKKADVQPFLDAEVIIKKKMAAWTLRKRELAAAAAERDRLRRQEEAERAAEEEAQRLAEEGDEDAAAEIYEDLAQGRIESSISVPEMPAEKPKAAGTTVKMVWKWAMVDRWKVSPAFMTPDEKAIGKLVRSMGDRALKLVGEGSIRVWEEAEIGSRAIDSSQGEGDFS